MSESIDWERRKDEAFKNLGRMKGIKGSGLESEYNQAYRKLVAEGKRLKLRAKYNA